jgi:membrane-associated phospholipid phosphatase
MRLTRSATEDRPLLYRAAYACSAVGNPLLTSAVFLSAFSLRLLDRSRAFEVVGALIVLLIFPIAIWNRSRVRSGHYSDFDVSRREDRTTMYPIVLGLVLVSTGMLFLTHQPKMISVGMLCVTGMIVAAFLTNRWIKISLHAIFSFFFAVVAIKISLHWVAPMLIFAGLVSSSRFILKRHTPGELVLGSAVGILTGCVLLFVLGYDPV